MRRFVIGMLLTPAALLLLAGSPGARSELPLPAGVTVEGAKVAYRIDRAEHVHRARPRGWPFPKDAACCAAPGVWFTIRHRHLVVGRGRRGFWRSRGEFPKRLGLGTVRFGVRSIAFTYDGRLYLAAVGGPERMIGRGEIPLGFTNGGFYTYRWNRDLRLRSDSGALLATIGRPLGRSTFTATDGVLYFLSRGDVGVMAARGSDVSALASLRGLGLPPRSTWFQTVGSLIELEDTHRMVLLRNDGSIFASTPLPRSHGHTEDIVGFVSPSPELDAVAFATDAGSGRSGTETVYLLRARARVAVPIHRQRISFQPCAQWAALAWHGDWLLYSNTAGSVDVIDTSSPHRTIELGPLVRHLRGVSSTNAYWTGHPPPFWS